MTLGSKNRKMVRRRDLQRHKERVFEIYGRVCECCQETRREFLCIDHNDGSTTRTRAIRAGKNKISGSYIWESLSRLCVRQPGIRLLCHNCNMSYGIYGYCPHQKEQEVTETLNKLIKLCSEVQR